MPVNVREGQPRVLVQSNGVGCPADVALAGQSTARYGLLAPQPPIVPSRGFGFFIQTSRSNWNLRSNHSLALASSRSGDNSFAGHRVLGVSQSCPAKKCSSRSQTVLPGHTLLKSPPWVVQRLARGSSLSPPHTLFSFPPHPRATPSTHIHGVSYSERTHEHHLDSLGPRVHWLRPLHFLRSLRATLLLAERDIPTSTISPQRHTGPLVCRRVRFLALLTRPSTPTMQNHPLSFCPIRPCRPHRSEQGRLLRSLCHQERIHRPEV